MSRPKDRHEHHQKSQEAKAGKTAATRSLEGKCPHCGGDQHRNQAERKRCKSRNNGWGGGNDRRTRRSKSR